MRKTFFLNGRWALKKLMCSVLYFILGCFIFYFYFFFIKPQSISISLALIGSILFLQISFCIIYVVFMILKYLKACSYYEKNAPIISVTPESVNYILDEKFSTIKLKDIDSFEFIKEKNGYKLKIKFNKKLKYQLSIFSIWEKIKLLIQNKPKEFCTWHLPKLNSDLEELKASMIYYHNLVNNL